MCDQKSTHITNYLNHFWDIEIRLKHKIGIFQKPNFERKNRKSSNIVPYSFYLFLCLLFADQPTVIFLTVVPPVDRPVDRAKPVGRKPGRPAAPESWVLSVGRPPNRPAYFVSLRTSLSTSVDRSGRPPAESG